MLKLGFEAEVISWVEGDYRGFIFKLNLNLKFRLSLNMA